MVLILDLNTIADDEIFLPTTDLNTIPLEDDIFVPLIDLNMPGDENSGSPIEAASLDASQEHLPNRSKRESTNDELQAIYLALLKESINGKLKKGTTTKVASLFSVSIQKVQRIWKRAKESDLDGQIVDISNRKPKNCGRKRIVLDYNQVRQVPLRQRTTLRSLATALGASTTTVFRRFKSGHIRRHSNAIKPLLKEENMKARLQFCISMLDRNSLPNNPRFINMHNIIHIDEKWFYMTKQSQKYYLLPEEEEPYRTCQSKNFITKVMFLAAIARPRYDQYGNETFSGKIGIFPFVTKEQAKRTSKNRTAGTVETKAITSVNKDMCRIFLIEKVLPAIRSKWPRNDARSPIFIQQDNAKPHIREDDAEFQKAARIDGFDIRLTRQPPNSPDLNVLDLGFFNAIQTLQHQEAPKSVNELIVAVEKSFDIFSSKKSDHIFTTLQACMIEIMKNNGSNKYRIPHMAKSMLQAEDRLPVQLEVDSALVEEVISQLQ